MGFTSPSEAPGGVSRMCPLLFKPLQRILLVLVHPEATHQASRLDESVCFFEPGFLGVALGPVLELAL